jgi:hypothetical protein
MCSGVLPCCLEHRIQAGFVELELEVGMAVLELQTVKLGAGNHGFARRKFGLPVGIRDHCRLPGRCDVFIVERLHRHDNEVELVFVAVVMMVIVASFFPCAVSMSVLMIMVVIVVMVTVADGQLPGSLRQRVNAGPLERILGFEEGGVELGGAREVEAANVEHGGERHLGVLRAQNTGRCVHLMDTRLQCVERGGRHEVGLVQDEHVGERDLLLHLGRGVDVLGDVFGVDHRDDGIETEAGAHLVIGEEGLGDRTRIGEAGGLDQDAVQTVLALHQTAKDADKVAPDGATDAPVVHLKDLFVALDDELVVHPYLAVLVFNHGQLFAVLLRQDAVEQGGLAGTEEAGEDGDGYGRGSGWTWRRTVTVRHPTKRVKRRNASPPGGGDKPRSRRKRSGGGRRRSKAPARGSTGRRWCWRRPANGCRHPSTYRSESQ